MNNKNKKDTDLKKELSWGLFKSEDKKLVMNFIIIPVVCITLLLGLALLNL
ncbi:MAG: hypothetical protein VX730_07510 [Pseudomonadota bacterium]|nr:hypothetical protein [Pseudomonadota bacterium]